MSGFPNLANMDSGKTRANQEDNAEIHHLFSSPQTGHLKVAKNGRVDSRGAKGTFARFTLVEMEVPKDTSNGDEHTGNHMYVCFRNVANPGRYLQVVAGGVIDGKGVANTSDTTFRIEKKLGPTNIYHPASGRYIKANERGEVKAIDSLAEATVFQHITMKGKTQMEVKTEAQPHPSRPLSTAKFSRDELLFFRDNGYIVAKDAVSKDLVEDALRKINRAIEKGQHGGGEVALDGLRSDGDGRFSVEVRRSPEITNLFMKSKVLS